MEKKDIKLTVSRACAVDPALAQAIQDKLNKSDIAVYKDLKWSKLDIIETVCVYLVYREIVAGTWGDTQAEENYRRARLALQEAFVGGVSCQAA